MSVDAVELRAGAYHDSVTLLRISQAVRDTEGIAVAHVAMATELNLDLATSLGFDVPAGATGNDLLIALRGNDDASLAAGQAAVTSALAAAAHPGGGAGFGQAAAPRSTRAAAALAPDASLVLLSVPGAAVIGEAMDAIDAGRHVMIFSDNVPIAHEVALKDAAADAGVLVMGPDCGTAIIAGVGLGFANVVRGDLAGPAVGVIAASGTGAQQLSCLLDDAGVGVSHVLGVGGRDLSAAVGGRSALAALALLDADPDTAAIVLLSKPPHASTRETVTAAADAAATPVSTVLLGPGQPDITSAAERLLQGLGRPVPGWRTWNPLPPNGSHAAGALRGLYAGGTLADEAMLVAGPVLGDIRSNIPLRPELALPGRSDAAGLPDLTGLGHVIVDLGDDAFTLGRPHPMIDPTVRLELVAAQADDPEVTVLLLDVVLGHGAEPDPAARLAPAIHAAIARVVAAGRGLTVVVTLCGTDGDPQDRQRQATALADAGAHVYASNAAAARVAAVAAAGRNPTDPAELARPGAVPTVSS